MVATPLTMVMYQIVKFMMFCLIVEPYVFSTWPEELQRKAVTLVWHMALLKSHVLKLIVSIILKDVLHSDVAVYLIQIVHGRYSES